MSRVVLRTALRAVSFLVLFVAAGVAFAQPYGLNTRSNLGAYLNGLAPATDPGPPPSGPNPPPYPLPSLLSQTGIFTDMATLAPNPGLVPYTLIQPLWSDGASKARWIGMEYNSASGTNPAITFSPTSEWQYPNGTVFVKHFEMTVNEQTGQKRRMETRLLVRDSTGWVYGVTYKWRPDGLEADLLPGRSDENLIITNPDGVTTRNQNYTWPSPADCQFCHALNGSDSTHGVLGPRTSQLNSDLAYTTAISGNGTGVTDNQLRTWNHLGMFTAALDEGVLSTYERLANIADGTATLEKRVRSYLDANCSGCHRSGGIQVGWFATYATPILSSNIAGGGPGARLRRFDPANSPIIIKDGLPSNMGGMPPVDKNVVHQSWIDLVTSWVNYFFDLASGNVPAAANNKVRVVFNSDLDPATATTIANYALDNGITISGAALEPDKRTVTLTTSAMSPGAPYKVTVNKVREAASPGNLVFPNSNKTFQNVAPAESVQLALANFSVSEASGLVTISVTRTGGAGAVSVNYATLDGTATAGTDYTATSGTLNWANGDTAPKTFTVALASDIAIEANEKFTVFLSNPTGAVIGSQLSATVTLADDDVFDFNGSGMADILWQHTDGRQAIWLMNGTAPAATSEIIGAGTGWSVRHVADLNADGKSDIVWQHEDGRAALYLMDGLAPIATNQILNAGPWTITHTPDLNGDGKADLIFQNADGTIAAWLMDGTMMTSGASIIGAGTGWAVTRTGDFDGDGKDDLLWTHTDGRVAIWLMDGLTVKATQQILNGATGWSATHTPDLNGDGKADIVWRNVDGTIAVWVMNGTTVTAGTSLLGAGTGWQVTRVGDFNGDGKADLFFLHADGRATIYLMDGITKIASAKILDGGGNWSARRVQDVNGDGKADIVWENQDGSVAIWLMDGLTLISGSGILGPGSGWKVSGVSQ